MLRDEHRLRQVASLAGVLAAGVAIAVGAVRALDLPPFAAAALGGIAVAVPLIAASLATVAANRTKRRREFGDLFDWPPPTIDEVDPRALGVFPSEIAGGFSNGHRPPYIPRELDPGVITAIKSESVVIVKGPPNAGKSRTAYEAALAALPGSKVLIPRTPDALSKLFRLDPPIQLTQDLQLGSKPGILWLDRLDGYLGDGGPDRSALDELARNGPRIVIIATIEDHLYQAVAVRSDRLPQSAIVRRASQTQQLGSGSVSELATAESVYPHETFLPREGIGEHFVATYELLGLLRDNVTSQPSGMALLRAVVDWRRAGLERPVPRELLMPLFQRYLTEPLKADLEATFDQAGAWTSTSVASSAKLVEKSIEKDATVFDPWPKLLSYFDESDNGLPESWRAIPATTWEYVLNHAAPDEAVAIGARAYSRSEFGIAEAAWSHGRKAENVEARSLAHLGLGELEAARGELDKAARHYRAIVKSGHPDVVPFARLELSVLMVIRGDLDGARHEIEPLLASNEPSIRAAGAAFQGEIAAKAGDFASAEKIYREVIELDDRFASSVAKVDLADLLGQSGRAEEAEGLLRGVLDGPDVPAAPAAAVSLGRILLLRGQLDEARAQFDDAINQGHPSLAPLAEVGLALLDLTTGDLESAERGLRSSIESRNPLVVPLASVLLARLLLGQGRTEAEAFARTAMGTGDRYVSGLGAIELGNILSARVADREEAEEAYRLALGQAHPAVVPLAQVRLASLLNVTGRYEEARELLEAAVLSGHLQAMPEADLQLATIHIQKGEFELARVALEEAVSSGNPLVAPIAHIELGNLAWLRDDLDEATSQFEIAAKSPNRIAAAMAQLQLATVQLQHDDAVEAEEGLHRLANSTFSMPKSLAQVALAGIYLDRGQLDAALELFQEVVDRGEVTSAPAASLALARIRLSEGQTELARPLFVAASHSASPVVRAMAGIGLGDLSATSGDVETARAAYELAIQFGAPLVQAEAEYSLALLIREEDPAGSLALLERAEDRGQEPWSTVARIDHAKAIEENDPEKAIALYRTAADSGSANAPKAAFRLAMLLAEREEFEEAERRYQDLKASGPPELSTAATVGLAELYAATDRLHEAGGALDLAVLSGDPTWLPIALLDRAELHEKLGDVDRALADYRQVVTLDDGELRDKALQRISELDA